MKRLCPLILLNFIIIEASHAHQMKNMSTKRNGIDLNTFKLGEEVELANYKGEHKKGAHFKVPSYSAWSRWEKCHRGRRVRRRHCLNREICGDALRIEVASCRRRRSRMKILMQEDIENSFYVQRQHIDMYHRKQLDSSDVQRKFRGFSPWGPWSACSRRCTTVRRRYCRKRSICGQKVIRQSAYCYLEGSYCQHWIRTRMQRRKDPGEDAHSSLPSSHLMVSDDPEGEGPKMKASYIRISAPQRNWLSYLQLPEHSNAVNIIVMAADLGYSYKLVESMPPPAPAIHPEDSRVLSTASLDCGRLGRYRGPAATRMKARMRDMVRIIGGRPAPPGKWPWQVVVLNRYKEAFCGGTLVSLRWVVTAAHCVRKKLYVRLGEHDLLIRGRGEVEMRVTEAVMHPRYDPDTVVNDVAMLRLPASARPDLGHGIACLPQPLQVLPPHTTCVILGWGKKRPTDVHGTRLLHEAQVSTIQQGVCRRSYWQYAITDNMVCAGRGRRDSCAGDSGGPLLCRDHNMRYYLQGITSFGDGCGKRGKYGIYTRTAGYVTWIREIINTKYFE